MKRLSMALAALVSSNVFASQYYCEKSAVNYITYIASAPYIRHGEQVGENDLVQISKRALGDGSEAYESYVYKRKDSTEIYRLKLYVQEPGEVCPLEHFEILSK